MIPSSTITRRYRSTRATDLADDPGLPGLTPERGLPFWPDPADYRRYLRKFARHYADGATRIDLDDVSGAHQYARTLKGIAASLGLPEVAAAARRLELALDTERPAETVAEAQDGLRTALAIAFYSIARYAPEAPEVDGNWSADWPTSVPERLQDADPRANVRGLQRLVHERMPPPGD